MNTSVKILLTINLEGGALVRQSKPEIINWTINEREMNPSKKWVGNDGLKIIKRGIAKHNSLVGKGAIRRVKLCKEAYFEMTSERCPAFSKKKLWLKMSETQRLESHMENYCQHMGGISFSYEVLED